LESPFFALSFERRVRRHASFSARTLERKILERNKKDSQKPAKKRQIASEKFLASTARLPYVRA
jgi:hypothetical protein